MKRCYIVCNGKLIPGTSVDRARQKLALHFKTSPAMLDRLFSGQTITVKRDIDYDAAEKFRKTAARCGVVFEIRAAGKPHAGHGDSIRPTDAKVDPRPLAAPPKKRNLFRNIRIAVLTVILCIVATGTWLQRRDVTDWKEPLNVIVYPIAGQDNATVTAYVSSLQAAQFAPIGTYFSQEAAVYELSIEQPFKFHLGPQIFSLPPGLPAQRNVLDVIWWSLKMRYWSLRNRPATNLKPDISIYAIYYKAQRDDLRENSLALQKGLIGLVHVYAHPLAEPKNNVIVAHEILHTLGATDKYILETGQPIYPDGYADPDQEPRYPQEIAEIMAGRIPQSPDKATMPPDLDHCLIGFKTALEIKWVEE